MTTATNAPNPASIPDVGKVEIQGEHASLIFQRRLKHPPEAVWAALTEAAQLEAWYAHSAKLDGRAGGAVELVVGPPKMRWTGRILTWDPPRVLEYEFRTEPREEIPQGEKESVVRYELARSGEGTVLTLTHRKLSKGTALGFAPGTHAFLDRLAAHLDGAALPNWMQRYGEVQAAYPSWSRRS
ncbi:MAG: SRPBCC family protein [Myxococcota bacterium]